MPYPTSGRLDMASSFYSHMDTQQQQQQQQHHHHQQHQYSSNSSNGSINTSPPSPPSREHVRPDLHHSTHPSSSSSPAPLPSSSSSSSSSPPLPPSYQRCLPVPPATTAGSSPFSMVDSEHNPDIDMKPLDLRLRPRREEPSPNPSSLRCSAKEMSYHQSQHCSSSSNNVNSSSNGVISGSSSISRSQRLSPYPIMTSSMCRSPLSHARTDSPFYPQRQTPSPAYYGNGLGSYYMPIRSTSTPESSPFRLLTTSNSVLNGMGGQTSLFRPYDDGGESDMGVVNSTADDSSSRIAEQQHQQEQQQQQQQQQGQQQEDEEPTYMDLDSATTKSFYSRNPHGNGSALCSSSSSGSSGNGSGGPGHAVGDYTTSSGSSRGSLYTTGGESLTFHQGEEGGRVIKMTPHLHQRNTAVTSEASAQDGSPLSQEGVSGGQSLTYLPAVSYSAGQSHVEQRVSAPPAPTPSSSQPPLHPRHHQGPLYTSHCPKSEQEQQRPVSSESRDHHRQQLDPDSSSDSRQQQQQQHYPHYPGQLTTTTADQSSRTAHPPTSLMPPQCSKASSIQSGGRPAASPPQIQSIEFSEAGSTSNKENSAEHLSTQVPTRRSFIHALASSAMMQKLGQELNKKNEQAKQGSSVGDEAVSEGESRTEAWTNAIEDASKVNNLDYWISQVFMAPSEPSLTKSCGNEVEHFTVDGQPKVRLRLVDLIALQVEESLKA